MGIGDFVEKAKELAGEHSDKVEEGLEKVADLVDEKTDGKYSDQVGRRGKGQGVSRETRRLGQA